jgi:hypothetical protein
MSAAQRVSRGFDRLGLFLASITLLVGGLFSVFYAYQEAGSALRPSAVSGWLFLTLEQRQALGPAAAGARAAADGTSINIQGLGMFQAPAGFTCSRLRLALKA